MPDTLLTCSACDAQGAEHRIADNGDAYCSACYDMRYALCDQCQSETPRSAVCRASGVLYCPACYDNTVTRCDSCDTRIRREDACSDENGDGCYCENCIPEREPENSAILNHDYKPRPVYYRETDERTEKLFFGFELEIQNRNLDSCALDSFAADISREWLYCKEDGSVSSGFEIVSHPHTWRALLAKREEINTLLTRINKRGFRSYNGGQCGLHVHVSREALNTLALFKLQTLVFRFPFEWQRLSRRSTESLKQWASVYTNPTKRDMLDKAKGDKREEYRYVGLNLQNDYTVEFRIFRGTLHEQTYWAILELVRGAVLFCSSRITLDKVNMGEFRDWMKTKNEYTNALALWARRFPEPTETTEASS